MIMNREILFRGRSFSDGSWVYGDLEYERNKSLLGKVRIHTYKEDGSYDRQHFVESDTVGQFTGQYDKNDKKIYEGDVVRWEYPDYDHCTGWRGTVKNVCKVTFEYGSFRINAYPYNLGSCEDFFEDKETYGLEVIGNVYDNPELLNEK